MTIRTDVSTSFPTGAPAMKNKKTAPAKTAAAMPAHHEMMGIGAHAAMKQLSASGQQGATVDPMRVFAELQDEGPTPRAPRQG